MAMAKQTKPLILHSALATGEQLSTENLETQFLSLTESQLQLLSLLKPSWVRPGALSQAQVLGAAHKAFFSAEHARKSNSRLLARVSFYMGLLR